MNLEYVSHELSLRSRLLHNVLIVLIVVLAVNFTLGIVRNNALVKLIVEAGAIAVLICGIVWNRRGRYDASAVSMVLATFSFVLITRLTDGFAGTYILSQNALAMGIIFLLAAVFIRDRKWLLFAGIAVCATYFGFLLSVILSGVVAPDIVPVIPAFSAPILLLPTIVVLGTCIASIFDKTSSALRVSVKEIAEGREELARLNAGLEQRVYERSMQLIEKSRHEALDSMVAGLSHRLNTPLGSAMTMTSFIKTRLKDGFSVQDTHRMLEAVELIERNLQRSIELMASYRELGSFASEDPTVYTTLGPFFVHLKNNIENLLEGEQVQVSYEYDEMLGLQIPMSHLHYVLIELVHNARIHADHDGQRIHIEGFAESGYLHLNVLNTGGSVSAETRARALDPFFTTAGDNGRLGLGLAKVQTIVREKLRGQIKVLEPDGQWAFRVNVSIPGVYVGHQPQHVESLNEAL